MIISTHPIGKFLLLFLSSFTIWDGSSNDGVAFFLQPTETRFQCRSLPPSALFLNEQQEIRGQRGKGQQDPCLSSSLIGTKGNKAYTRRKSCSGWTFMSLFPHHFHLQSCSYLLSLFFSHLFSLLILLCTFSFFLGSFALLFENNAHLALPHHHYSLIDTPTHVHRKQSCWLTLEVYPFFLVWFSIQNPFFFFSIESREPENILKVTEGKTTFTVSLGIVMIRIEDTLSNPPPPNFLL